MPSSRSINERLKDFDRTARRYWPGFSIGVVMLGSGIAIEATDYRPEPAGAVTIIGGIACMLASSWPNKRWDNANDLVSTYREIRSLPETPNFTDEG